MTKLEAAEKLVKQDGNCTGISCGNCPLFARNCDQSTTEKAQNYINTHKFNIGTTFLVSNDNIHWKERELSLIHEGCYICHTNNRKGFKCWRYAKEAPKTEIWYQYFYQCSETNKFYITDHCKEGKGRIRIEESAKEVEVV